MLARSAQGSFGLVCATFSLVALACSPTLPPPTLQEAPKESRKTDQFNLLLFPEANGEALLGRAVQVTKEGGWTIAEARSPGCEVDVRKDDSEFRSTREVALSAMTSLAGSYAKVVSIEARFGHANSAAIDVANKQVLRANTRGACGEYVIDSVFVGRGSRKVLATAEMGGSAHVQVGLASGSPSMQSQARILDTIEWGTDQAYGFTFRANSKTQPLDLRVMLPSIVDEGEEVSIRIEAARPAWLVVYYLDGAGHADVLWPSNEEPEPTVTPERPLVLPTDRERSEGFTIKAALAKTGESSRETLVTYAFTERADFLAMKPSGGNNTDGAAFAASLTKMLGSIPMDRWSRSLVTYVIEPKKKK